jgi:trehalose/maltose hydrolase-like predicted phosphorylase
MHLQATTNDIQGGTTGEGIHAGVMAGTILIAQQSYAGLNLKGDIVAFSPKLPEHWRNISFGFTFKEADYYCNISKKSLTLKQTNKKGVPVQIGVNGAVQEIPANLEVIINY